MRVDRSMRRTCGSIFDLSGPKPSTNPLRAPARALLRVHSMNTQGGAPEIRERLVADHRRVDELLGRMQRAAEAKDREALSAIFTEFDAGLRSHLEAEEKFLLPSLLRDRARDGRVILEEHKHIRARLLELAAAVDLHTVRVEDVRVFGAELRAHARHEDTLLYQWADAHLGELKRLELRLVV